jgi:putative nucleotidyltransferase with HDIG domain
MSEQTAAAESATDGVSARLAQQVEEIVLRRIASDALVLPTLPAIANRIFEGLGDSQLGAQKAADLVGLDPLLAARLLRPAAAMLAKGKKPTLLEMVGKLGTRSVRGSLYEAAIQQLTTSRDPKIGAAVRSLFTHSRAVAQLARDLAALGGPGAGDPDVAFLAGLLHDVGKPVVATVLLEAERQLVRTSKKAWISAVHWMEVVDRVHRKVGAALAEKWQLPEAVQKCVRDCSEYDNADRASPANLVVLANALAKREGLQAGAVDAADVEAIVMIGRSLLGVSDELIDKVCAGIKDRVDIY